MALGPRLDIRQSQSLVMTPQLQQAIKLLALSTIEIEAWLAGELERNPLLELARGEGGEGPPPGADGEAADEQAGEAEEAAGEQPGALRAARSDAQAETGDAETGQAEE